VEVTVVAPAKKKVNERPKLVVIVEPEDNRVMTAVKLSFDGVVRVIWRATTVAGAHAVADFLDGNPTVARVAWEQDGRGD
jgi:hypothetical protein